MEYYIRHEGYLGNALLWWRIGGGYTCDIKQAKKMSLEDAEKTCKRNSDTAYRVEYIDNLLEAQKLIIDSQYVDNKEQFFNN